MATVTVSSASERFGQAEKGKTKLIPYSRNHWVTRIHHLRQELCILKKGRQRVRKRAELQKSICPFHGTALG